VINTFVVAQTVSNVNFAEEICDWCMNSARRAKRLTGTLITSHTMEYHIGGEISPSISTDNRPMEHANSLRLKY